ncbi:hypothetical protein BU15DRAFT_63609 [Melanogaster broomeanus]|nr:hypothetical protein BU15DRAFT_63609 [Melanogaster broomeanus]
MSVTAGYHKIKTSSGKYLTLLSQTGNVTAQTASGATNQTWDVQPAGSSTYTVRNTGYDASTYAYSAGQNGSAVNGSTSSLEWSIVVSSGNYFFMPASDSSLAWNVGDNNGVTLTGKQLTNSSQQFTVVFVERLAPLVESTTRKHHLVDLIGNPHDSDEPEELPALFLHDINYICISVPAYHAISAPLVAGNAYRGFQLSNSAKFERITPLPWLFLQRINSEIRRERRSSIFNMSITHGYHKIKTASGKYLTLLSQSGHVTAQTSNGATNQTPPTHTLAGQSGSAVVGSTSSTEWSILVSNDNHFILPASDSDLAWSVDDADTVKLADKQLQNMAISSSPSNEFLRKNDHQRSKGDYW